MGLLRVLLALTVVVGHNQWANQRFGPGVYIAVKAFFIISGFYMALILSERYQSIGRFYINRALRLYPIYLIVLALSVVAATASGGAVGPFIDLNRWSWPALDDSLASLLALANVTMIGIDVTVLGCLTQQGIIPFDGGCGAGYILNNFILVPQAWSLSVELLFYAIAPLIVRLSNRRFVAILVMGLGLRLAIDLSAWNVNTWHRSFGPFEMPYFLLGVAAYRLHQAGWLRQQALAFGLLLVTPFYFAIESAAGVDIAAENWVWWAYFGLLTLALPSLFSWFKDLRWDREIGELSYPIYISHLLVFGLLDTHLAKAFPILGHWGWLALSVSTVVLASWALVRLVGVPVDKLRQQIASELPARRRAVVSTQRVSL